MRLAYRELHIQLKHKWFYLIKISSLKTASVNANPMDTVILSAFHGFTPSSSLSDDLRLLSHCRKNNRCPKELMQYSGKPEHTRFLIKGIGHYINIFDRPQCLKNVFVLAIIISGLNLNSFCQYWLVSSMACSKWWSQMIWNLVDVKMVPLHTTLINPKLQQPHEVSYQSNVFHKLGN